MHDRDSFSDETPVGDAIEQSERPPSNPLPRIGRYRLWRPMPTTGKSSAKRSSVTTTATNIGNSAPRRRFAK
jgi:hypothetical protein